jgi:hypothetical protein
LFDSVAQATRVPHPYTPFADRWDEGAVLTTYEGTTIRSFRKHRFWGTKPIRDDMPTSRYQSLTFWAQTEHP